MTQHTEVDPRLWFRLIALLSFVALVIVCSKSLIAQEEKKAPDARAIDLRKWLGDAGVDTSGSPFLVFVASVDQCAQCCAAAVNGMVRSASSHDAKFRAVVIVLSESKGEGVMLDSFFPGFTVVESKPEIVSRLLPIDRNGPSAFVIDSNGEILARFYHIQTFPPSETVLESALSCAGSSSAGVHEFMLQESEKLLVGDILTPVLTHSGKTLSFVEPRQNAIYTYDVATGVLKNRWLPPTELGMYYRFNSSDTAYWSELSRVYTPLVSILGLSRLQKTDTLLALTMMFDHWDTSRNATGRLNLNWRRNFSLINMVDSHWSAIRRISVNGHVPQPPIVTTMRGAVTGSIWSNYEAPRGPGVKDSSYVLVSFALDSPVVRPLLPASAIDTLYGSVYDPSLYPRLARVDDSSFLMVSTSNGIFGHVMIRENRIDLFKIVPNGLLDTAVRERDRDSTRRLSARGIVCGDGRFAVVIADRRNSHAPRIVVQHYTQKGQFLSEAVVVSRNAELMESYVADSGDGTYALLLKWSDVRWRIVNMRL